MSENIDSAEAAVPKRSVASTDATPKLVRWATALK
jgi:hypothetical protein